MSPDVAVAPSSSKQVRRGLALALALAALLLVVLNSQVRVGEAWLQAQLLTLGGLRTVPMDSVVLVSLNGQWAGIALTTGCSVGPLLALFLAGAAPLLWWRDLPVRRMLIGLVQLALVLVVANQFRIAAIVIAMDAWGVRRGYDLAHVFLGSAITTVGFVVGLLLLARSLSKTGPVAS